MGRLYEKEALRQSEKNKLSGSLRKGTEHASQGKTAGECHKLKSLWLVYGRIG